MHTNGFLGKKMRGAAERYKVVSGSISVHCCFEASVVDTQTPHPRDEGEPAWVCECFDTADAQKVADALNAANDAQQAVSDLAASIASAAASAGLQISKIDNRRENLGVTPALALACAILGAKQGRSE